ncbi:hypothetical protein BGZ90_011758 [Linnemannia elongata]|nr:hypothetical protein BGZ90_011758 [Linnemannia elongata]
MEPSDIAPVMPELTPQSLDQRISISTPEANIDPVSLGSYSLAPTAQVAAVTTKSSVASSPSSSITTNSLRLGIFSANVTRHGLVTDLPKSCARIKNTAQLVYSCSVLAKAHIQPPLVSDSDKIQGLPLDDSQREWIQYLGRVEQDRIRWLVDQLVKAFTEDHLKRSEAITEIVLVGPVLDREAYRGLLACFISKFEQTTPLDLNYLQGIVQLVECASSAYLVDDDLVRIATVISKDLSVTHNGTSDHPLYLTWALSRVLDVLVAGNSGNTYLKYQAAYAYQALQYAPDDETPLQVL